MHRILYTLLVLVAALCLTAPFATAQTTQCPAGSKPQTTQQNGNTLTECVPDTTKAPVQTGGCPTGTTAAIDPDTHQFACIPLGNTSADPYTAKRPVLNTDFNATSEQAEVPANLQTLDQQRQQADRVASEQYNVNEQSNQNFFETVNTPSRERARKKKEREAAGREGSEAPGWNLELGTGYGLPASWLLHLSATYTIPNLKPIPGKDTRLGIFADINVNVPWPLGFTLTGGAKLITNWSNFQLSAGLGIGVTYHDYSMLELFEDCNSIYGVYGYNQYSGGWHLHEENGDESIISVAAFTLKPMLEFDWFITRHWFVGFAFDLPFNLGGATGGEERGEYGDSPVRCYRNEYYDGDSECFAFESEFVFFMQFDIYFHAGYKF